MNLSAYERRIAGMWDQTRSRLLVQGVLVVLLAVLSTAWSGSQYSMFLFETIAVYVIAATGLNIAVGLTGQFQLAMAGIMGISAYTTAILANSHGWNTLTAAFAGVGLSLVTGAVVAALVVRARSHYLLLATFSMQILIIDMLKNYSGLTGGVNGTEALNEFKIGSSTIVGSTASYTVVLVVVAGLGLVCMDWLKRSYWGLGMQATRQNEFATAAAGVSPAWYRAAGIIVSAVFGGVAGVLYGPTINYLTPDSFGLDVTLLLLVVVVVGGIGSVIGVLVACVGLTYASQEAQAATTAWPLFYGALVMILLVFTPVGLSGITEGVLSRLRGGEQPPPVVEPPPMSFATVVEMIPAARHDRPAQRQATGTKPAPPPPLSVTDVERAFGGVHAVGGVSLEVAAGAVHGVVGPNGSGKTTLFNLISGFVKPDKGEIHFRGQDISRMAPAARARLGLARSFQHPNLLDRGTVWENVSLGLMPEIGVRHRAGHSARMPDPDLARRLDEVLDLVKLSDLAQHPVADLPYGQKRLVDVARAVVAMPKVVLLDEPTSGVGAESVRILESVVRWLQGQGIAVLLVEHNMRFVAGHCSHLTVLNAGRVLASGDPSAVVREREVVEAYMGAD
jgi:branched-chain amino acid transport system permease protein